MGTGSEIEDQYFGRCPEMYQNIPVRGIFDFWGYLRFIPIAEQHKRSWMCSYGSKEGSAPWQSFLIASSGLSNSSLISYYGLSPHTRKQRMFAHTKFR